MSNEITVTEEEFQERFEELFDLVDTQGVRVIITRDGEPSLIMIPYEEYQHYQSIIDSDWHGEDQ